MKNTILKSLAVASFLAPWLLSPAWATPPETTEAETESTAMSEEPATIAPTDGKEENTSASSSALAGDTSSGNAGISGSAGAGGGRFNFQTDLATGRFTYSVPIVVAPARQGAQPTLALSYNSASGNGWCGVGWNLDVGFIQRETRKGVPVKWNYSTGSPLPQYDDSKGFIANFFGSGSTLILVSATNVNPLVYRQEVETAFLTYKYYNDNHWEIVDKGGNTFYLGEGSTNRMENIKTGWTAGSGNSTFRWALNRVVDVNGNQTFLKYGKDGGVLYLTNITYNGNVNAPAIAATHTVDFVLASRPDTNVTYNSGYRVEVRKRLAEIQVKAAGINVRKYALAYVHSQATTRSLLTSVTEYGSDFSSSLPPVKFTYQTKPFEFFAETNWVGVSAQGLTDGANNAISSGDGYGNRFLAFNDLDADGFPDRVMRRYPTPHTNFIAQFNDGGKFRAEAGYGPVSSQGQAGFNWNSPVCGDGNSFNAAMLDINGDGRLDRIVRKVLAPYTNFTVQLNNGAGFNSETNWGPVSSQGLSSSYDWNSIYAGGSSLYVNVFDINGDGLPDRVMRKYLAPYTNWVVQFNTGGGFTSEVNWSPLSSQGQTDYLWNALTLDDGLGDSAVTIIDINGDSLPDRVMRRFSAPYTNGFVVQLNNGYGFEPEETWGPLLSQGNTDYYWNSPICGDTATINVSLADINGDGLPDRVMRKLTAPYTNFVVQLNTGTGFGPATNWNGVTAQGITSYDWNSPTASTAGYTYVDLVDINGDGLPDRVMRRWLSPYTNLVVQLNKGPFPDLLNVVSNGLGGVLFVAYSPSTIWNNRDRDWTNSPWAEGAKSLLSFNVYTVTNITSFDGLSDANQVSYSYKGGFFDSTKREFRGFCRTEVTDPLGTKTRTYFHQSGGRNESTLGEFQDQTSVAKKGIPFRVEVIGGDGLTNRVTLNKVEEAQIHANGCYFPYIAQTMVMTYEGLSNYRATAKQLFYDTTTGNLTKDVAYGEVMSVDMTAHTFSDVISTDNVYTHTTYASFSNPHILSKPSSIKITSDNAGTVRLRETQLFYEGVRGNLTNTTVWLNTANAFISSGMVRYDQYGNPTNTISASGISTTTYFDTTYRQYPIQSVTATFTNLATFDIRSGQTITVTDVNGLIASNYVDVFYRTKETYISTSAYAAPTLWRTRMDYNLGGLSSGITYNFVRKRVFDGVDTANGHETYVYADGLGRAVQTRVESETGQYRASDVFYDERGNANYQTLPYFSSGSGFTILTGTKLGSLTEYDNVGRAFRVTPAYQVVFDGSGNLISQGATGGDSGSPVAPVTTAFKDGSDPWATVVTDSENKVKKSYVDGFGRVTDIFEVCSGTNITTHYTYDLLGNLTYVTDVANNSTAMSYDSLGRKTSMIDPDMGTWNYVYDNAGRMTQQTDARNNKLKFYFSDPLGRISSKEIYNSANTLVSTITYTYDTSDDANYTVFKGQLYKVTDRQGWLKNSYDIRGRVIKAGRYVNPTSTEYITQTTFDDADRVQQIVYPGNAATIKYSYDTAGNVSKVESLAGTGTKEVFYQPLAYDAVGLLLGCTNGNGVVTSNTYYANTKRIQRTRVTKGATVLQDRSYTYDKVSNIKSILDGVYAGTASGSITNAVYDDLHRLTQVGATASGIKNYAYSGIGNTLTNGEAGAGRYTYGVKPHAVTNANGKSYTYDACGNMTGRGTQTLTYDEENQLIQVTGASTTTFGYADGGSRLWRAGATGYTIWIGGIYEIKDGKTLCHVSAGGTRVVTFEPLGGGPFAQIFGDEKWFAANSFLNAALIWPFEEGRTPYTCLLVSLLGILGVCVAARRQFPIVTKLRRRTYPQLSKCWQPRALWQQAVTFVSLTALILATMPGDVYAQSYTPVFYYHYGDHLGSSNVMTDRSGVLVQHYEYSAFGKETHKNNMSAFSPSCRYTGQVLDEETGLYYYNARYYDPELGRFVQADTIVQSPGNPQTLNRYSYSNNNPLKYNDPTGHSWEAVAALIVYVAEAAIVGAALGAISAAIQKGDILSGALNGALAGAAYAIGGVAGSIALAAAKGEDIGKAALLAVVSAAISFGAAQLSIDLIGQEINNFSSFAGHTAIQSAGGAVSGLTAAAIQGADIGEGALNGAIGAATAASGKYLGNLAKYKSAEFARDLGVADSKMAHLLPDSWRQKLAASINQTSCDFVGIELKPVTGMEAVKQLFIPLYSAHQTIQENGSQKLSSHLGGMIEKVGAGALKIGYNYVKDKVSQEAEGYYKNTSANKSREEKSDDAMFSALRL